jgi:ABC-2 type transport system permease protein
VSGASSFFEVLTLELRRRFVYRTDFWIRSILSVAVQGVISYAVWASVFSVTGASSIGGYTLSELVVYYLFAGLVVLLVRPDFGFVARDIYDGSLTKFFVLPTSFFLYKLGQQSSQVLLVLLQLALVAVFVSLNPGGVLNGAELRWDTFALGVVACLGAAYLYYVLAFLFELPAFWMEEVWSLPVSLMFAANFLGGLLLPIAVFPRWAQDLISLTPFPYLISVPVRAFLGELSPFEVARGLGVIAIWCGFVHLAIGAVWRRGVSRYTGVGQ